MSTQSPPSHRPQIPPAALWFAIIGCIAVITFFYAIMPGFGPGRTGSILRELYQSWNEENRFEHGPIYPFIIIGLIAFKWKHIRDAITPGDIKGLVFIAIGVFFFLVSYRVIQWRIGVGSLAFIASGMVWYLWGRKVFLLSAFPIFYICLAVPLPDVQQATVPLQNISVKISQALCSLCGVDTIAQGSKISSATNNWKPLEIDEACSGIRSLMALLMISSVWAYIARMALWKKGILLLSAIPISIIGNGLRVASIFIMAEYGNEEFAGGTWHDNSGLLLFYPISLILMMMLHALLEGWRPWKKAVVKRTLIKQEKSAPTHPQS
jgi:exosortase